MILKPVFGTLADRIGGARPVLIGVDRLLHRLGSVRGRRRFGVAVARPPGTGRGRIRFLPPGRRRTRRPDESGHHHGRAFGTYGFYKSLGYTLGPLLGGALVWAGDLTALFMVLAVLSAFVALWAAIAVPALAPLPKSRQTIVDLAAD